MSPLVNSSRNAGRCGLTCATMQGNGCAVEEIRRTGWLLITWRGHNPRRVRVYRGVELIGKWDLENTKAMKGGAPIGRLDGPDEGSRYSSACTVRHMSEGCFACARQKAAT